MGLLQATDLDELKVAEGSDVEVRSVLLRRQAAVELGVAAADRQRVAAAQRGRAV